MRKVCIYGKGGIGKSTVVANAAAAAAKAGNRVMVVGCDPKADTTRVLMHGRIETILDVHARLGGRLTRADAAHEGAFGVLCMESGGPRAGEGCAGKGIALALKDIQELRIVEEFAPDLILYDVLGDVVCGGFSTPLREKVAEAAYIVTTSDYMSLYAANGICRCIRKYADRGGCRLGGLIYNERSAVGNESAASDFARAVGTRIAGRVPLDRAISRAEMRRSTVIECEPDSAAARAFEVIADEMLHDAETTVPEPLSTEALEAIGERIAAQFAQSEEGFAR
ncbi:MAG: AAA family ATPase [Aristaeellaceae bacterium]